MRSVAALLLLSVCPAYGAGADPFAGMSVSSEPAQEQTAQTRSQRFFADNFGWRNEVMSQFGFSDQAAPASRQSAGFEALKKFSSETKTFASVDLQGRLVRRDRFVGSLNDLEGAGRQGWSFEYHNAYADFYDLAGPVGKVNARIGRFYVPFGLNLQTDTHGSVLQLSNERNFGFERDWYAGFWGPLTDDLNYDAYYLAGSGYDLKYKGQSGLGAARLSLANRYANEYGLEGGLSVIGGQRLSSMTSGPIDTTRAGIDGRLRRAVPTGSVAWSSEVSGGRDAPDSVFTQLHQLEYLHASRRWGLSAQYRRFWQQARDDDASLFCEATWYFRNDVSNSSLHWLKLNVERQLERQAGNRALIATLQYYRYW